MSHIACFDIKANDIIIIIIIIIIQCNRVTFTIALIISQSELKFWKGQRNVL